MGRTPKKFVEQAKVDNTSRKWLRNMNRKQKEAFALKVPCHASFIHAIGLGTKTPSREMLAKMENAADGQIRASDFDFEARLLVKAVSDVSIGQ